MSSVVTVFGATGFVGSAVARTLVSHGWHVRGVTRDPNNPKAAALKSEGIQLVYVDPMDTNSVLDALRGATACFVQTQTDFTHPECYKTEVAHGKCIADACKDAGVSHVVYSTQLSVVKVIGMSARHMDAKADVEQYMRQIGLPLTSLIIPFTYEQLLMPPYKPTEKNGCYEIGVPMGNTPLHMICTEDVGPVLHQILSNPRAYNSKTLSICGDNMTVKDIAQVFSRVLHPHRFRDQQVTVLQFRDQGLPSSVDMAAMFDFYCRVDQRASLDQTRKLHPGTQNLEQWLSDNMDIARDALIHGRASCSSLHAL